MQFIFSKLTFPNLCHSFIRDPNLSAYSIQFVHTVKYIMLTNCYSFTFLITVHSKPCCNRNSNISSWVSSHEQFVIICQLCKVKQPMVVVEVKHLFTCCFCLIKFLKQIFESLECWWSLKIIRICIVSFLFNFLLFFFHLFIFFFTLI